MSHSVQLISIKSFMFYLLQSMDCDQRLGTTFTGLVEQIVPSVNSFKSATYSIDLYFFFVLFLLNPKLEER